MNITVSIPFWKNFWGLVGMVLFRFNTNDTMIKQGNNMTLAQMIAAAKAPVAATPVKATPINHPVVDRLLKEKVCVSYSGLSQLAKQTGGKSWHTPLADLRKQFAGVDLLVMKDGAMPNRANQARLIALGHQVDGYTELEMGTFLECLQQAEVEEPAASNWIVEEELATV